MGHKESNQSNKQNKHLPFIKLSIEVLLSCSWSSSTLISPFSKLLLSNNCNIKHKGSYIRAQILLILLKELRKRDISAAMCEKKIKKFIIYQHTEHYHMILKYI